MEYINEKTRDKRRNIKDFFHPSATAYRDTIQQVTSQPIISEHNTTHKMHNDTTKHVRLMIAAYIALHSIIDMCADQKRTVEHQK